MGKDIPCCHDFNSGHLSLRVHVFSRKTYRVTRRHQQKIQAQAEAVQAGNGLNISRYKRSAANALFVYYFLLLCYTPLFVTLSLSSIS